MLKDPVLPVITCLRKELKKSSQDLFTSFNANTGCYKFLFHCAIEYLSIMQEGFVDNLSKLHYD